MVVGVGVELLGVGIDIPNRYNIAYLRLIAMCQQSLERHAAITV